MEDKAFDPTPSIQLKVLNPLPDNPEGEGSRFPSWLHRQIPRGKELFQTDALIRRA